MTNAKDTWIGSGGKKLRLNLDAALMVSRRRFWGALRAPGRVRAS